MASDTMSIKILMARSVVIPRLIFSVLSSSVEAGVKKPVMATMVMIEVGMIRLTT